ncbi:hypothetical protein Tco_0278387 [Tanacetum coccineum]
MMYERPPPIIPFQNPPRNTTLMFQQHQGESLYDAWTRFKNLIQRVPHHGLNLWYLSQFFYDHVYQYTQMDLDFAANENLGKLGIEEAWETIKNFAQGQKENENVWVEMHRYIAWDKVDNPNQQNTSPSEIIEPYEPSPRMDSYEQPSCLRSTIISKALRKSDQMHQTFEKSYLAMTHELDDMIELPKCILEEIRVTWAQLEKKRTRPRLYTDYLDEIPNSGWRWRRQHKATASGSFKRRRQGFLDGSNDNRISTTVMSFTEAEYITAAKALIKAVWMRKFIDGLGDVVPSNKRPMEMLCDNEPKIAIANDLRIFKGSRHFQRKYHYIREVIQEREIVLKKVHTDDNVADLFIKPMPFNKHYEHAMAIGIVLASSLM